jgi:hypothetical protein
MTIGYFKAGSDIKYDIADFETTKVSTEKTFMKHNNGKEMEFN